MRCLRCGSGEPFPARHRGAPRWRRPWLRPRQAGTGGPRPPRTPPPVASGGHEVRRRPSEGASARRPSARRAPARPAGARHAGAASQAGSAAERRDRPHLPRGGAYDFGGKDSRSARGARATAIRARTSPPPRAHPWWRPMPARRVRALPAQGRGLVRGARRRRRGSRLRLHASPQGLDRGRPGRAGGRGPAHRRGRQHRQLVGPHLHFEIWVGGWYTGGEPIDPLPLLREWAGLS